MASPFSIFRKHQKFLMMLACLLAIVAFVFLPYLGKTIGEKPGGRQDLVVVKTTKYGDLLQSEMSRLRGKRQVVRTVLTELAQAARHNPTMVQRYLDNYFPGPLTDEALADTWLKVQRAQEMGMVVSNDTINRFLGEWTENSVKIGDIQAIFTRARVTDDLFFDMIREELLAQQLGETFASSVAVGNLPIATPSQRWDYYNRLNCMAVIEAVPVTVADFVTKVAEPTDDELKKFFEENKEVLPNPESPKPGFRRPEKVALEYFKADIEKFTALHSVTDAEVLEQYEQNREYYDKKYKIPSTVPPPAKEGAAKDVKNAKEATPKQEPKKAKEDAPKAGKPVEPKKEPKTPKEENKEPTAEKKEPKAAKDAPKPESKEPIKAQDSKGASSAVRPSPFMLAAMQQPEKSGEAPPVKSPAKTEPPVKNEPPAKSAPPAKAASPVAKSEQPSAAAKEQKPAAKPAALPKTPEDLVADLPPALVTEIRKGLATRKAIAEIRKAFDRLKRPMEEFQQKQSKFELRKIQFEHEKKKVPPAPLGLDFEKLAKENGLSAGRTGLMSRWEAMNSEIGTSVVQGTGEYVWAFAYQSLPKFRSTASIDASAAYLFWKNKDVKEYTPKFGDKGVRDEVLRSWKLIQARDLAMKAAKSMAAEARSVAKPLKRVWPDLKIVLPPKFSWMTVGNVAMTSQQRIDLSPVAGVDMARDEFMETVFRLEPGQVGVAFNAPKTMVYVVRPSEFTPSYDVRWKLFLIDDFRKYASVGMEDQMKIRAAWVEEMKKSAGFEWGPGHQADQTREREQADRDLPGDDED